jgi:hypothetical protein
MCVSVCAKSVLFGNQKAKSAKMSLSSHIAGGTATGSATATFGSVTATDGVAHMPMGELGRRKMSDTDVATLYGSGKRAKTHVMCGPCGEKIEYSVCVTREMVYGLLNSAALQNGNSAFAFVEDKDCHVMRADGVLYHFELDIASPTVLAVRNGSGGGVMESSLQFQVVGSKPSELDNELGSLGFEWGSSYLARVRATARHGPVLVLHGWPSRDKGMGQMVKDIACICGCSKTLVVCDNFIDASSSLWFHPWALNGSFSDSDHAKGKKVCEITWE